MTACPNSNLTRWVRLRTLMICAARGTLCGMMLLAILTSVWPVSGAAASNKGASSEAEESSEKFSVDAPCSFWARAARRVWLGNAAGATCFGFVSAHGDHRLPAHDVAAGACLPGHRLANGLRAPLRC